MTKQTSARYSPEVRARAVRMVLEHQSDHPSQWAAMSSIASKIGCAGETLRKWVRQPRAIARPRARCHAGPGRRGRVGTSPHRGLGFHGTQRRTFQPKNGSPIQIRDAPTAWRAGAPPSEPADKPIPFQPFVLPFSATGRDHPGNVR